MTRKSFPINSLVGIFLLAIFTAMPNLSSAQTTFSSETEWLASLCGEVVNDELEFGQSGFGVSLDLTLTTSWGTFDYSDTEFSANNGFSVDDDLGIVISEPPVTLTTDPALGEIEGISIGYAAFPGILTIELADGTIITEDIPADGDGSNTSRLFFGWTNTTGQSVANVSVQAADVSPDPAFDDVFLFFGIGFSFGEVCDTEPTCQDQLQDVIDALQVKLVSASGDDQVWIAEAIYELQCAQDPTLWETDNRLSDLGTVFFGKNFYATYYLQCTYDQALVEDCLTGIQDLLGCVVDAEIAYALANPDANSNLLAYSECFEEYADAFADAELYLEAVLLHFYAWLFANNA